MHDGTVGGVPRTCNNQQKCRLVLSLHGCLQTADQIGKTVVTDAYLNQYADSNKLVVLYPQATPDDTFGYATRSGPQMITTMNMVHALGG